MSTSRNWREFNDAWRNPEWSTKLHARLLTAERFIRRFEPLGILLAVIGLAVSIFAFQIDYADRTVARKLRAWEIVTSEGPVNGGKREALGFLIENGKDIAAAKLSGARLAQIDLSSFDLRNIDLSGAGLKEADLRGADLHDANLNDAFLFSADLRGAALRGADLSGAQLRKTNLRGANLREANLKGAILIEADLTRAWLLWADFSGANLVNASLGQRALNSACGDEQTMLRPSLTIPMCSEVDWYEEIHGERN